jgi:LemA protein
MTAVVVVLAFVTVVALLAGGTAFSFNRFVRQRNLVHESWRQADVELRRRHDLIPNLVETVKGYAAHERAVLQGVTDARGSAVDASQSDDTAVQGAAGLALSRALGRLVAVAEQYPDLKANATFRQL